MACYALRYQRFYGNLPIYKKGSNSGRLNHALVAKKLGWTLAEVAKAYSNWVMIFRYPESTLTLVQYADKLRETSIRPFDVGCRKGKWHLARYGDIGPYTKENCRFIPQEENLAEQVGRVDITAALLNKYGEEGLRQVRKRTGQKLKALWEAKRSGASGEDTAL